MPTAGTDVQFNAGGGKSVDDLNLGGSLKSLTLNGFTGALTLQQGLSVQTLTQSSGTITGGPLSVSGSNTWSGGQIGNGNTQDVLAIQPGAQMTINSGGGLSLRILGTQIENGGSIFWQGATNITLLNGALINNWGTFLEQSTNDNTISSIDATGTFINEQGATLRIDNPSQFLVNMSDNGGADYRERQRDVG